MPSVWKRIVFSVASVLSVGSAVLLVVALSTARWVSGTFLCQTGVDLVNATSLELDQFTGQIHFGLFQGGKTRRCGLGSRQFSIYVFPELVRKLNGGLHMTVILFLFVAIGFALVSLAFCVYNARKVPYQSIKGPLGLYIWNLIAALFGSLAVACFLASMRHHRLTERVANFGEALFHLVVLEEQVDLCFWLCVSSVGTHAANLLVVVCSRIHLPKIQTKKPEEPTTTADDLLY